MSVVACRIDDKGYSIAADSIMVRGWTQDKGKKSTMSKLFEVDSLIVGGVGTVEEISLLQIFASTHQIAHETEAAVLEFISEFSDWKKKKMDKAGIENAYLIGMGKSIFSVNGWNVMRIITHDAIGAGMDFALAALHLGHTPKEAVQVATELSVLCEGPIQAKSRQFDTEEVTDG